jgi:trehalose 6-phosphate synthase
VTFVPGPEGDIVQKRGVGGLVSALSGAIQSTDGLWIASAMSEQDRSHAGRTFHADVGSGRSSLRYLSFDPETYAGYYDSISNRILWFVHHLLWDLPRTPQLQGLTGDWAAYRSVNQSFADALAEQGGSGEEVRYLVQDYHLSLVPAMLRRARPDARIALFWHIPFAGQDYYAILPEWLREDALRGMLGADVVGFQAPAWAERFLGCCRGLPGAVIDEQRSSIRWEGRDVKVAVYPITIDPDRLRSEAADPAVARARRALQRVAGDGQLMARVDRAELSKNILRGFIAFEALLKDEPGRRGDVTFVAQLNPSRGHIAEYRAYIRECLETADRINRRFRRKRWTPIQVRMEDDFPRALAVYQLYDVLLVNPVFDGMNLVAKEGPVLNERDGVLVLSETAGAFTELGPHALRVNPLDIEETARVMGQALDMEPPERAERLRGLKDVVEGHPIERWLGEQLEDLDRAGGDEDDSEP